MIQCRCQVSPGSLRGAAGYACCRRTCCGPMQLSPKHGLKVLHKAWHCGAATLAPYHWQGYPPRTRAAAQGTRLVAAGLDAWRDAALGWCRAARGRHSTPSGADAEGVAEGRRAQAHARMPGRLPLPPLQGSCRFCCEQPLVAVARRLTAGGPTSLGGAARAGEPTNWLRQPGSLGLLSPSLSVAPVLGLGAQGRVRNNTGGWRQRRRWA
jgi:hypothetical protein